MTKSREAIAALKADVLSLGQKVEGFATELLALQKAEQLECVRIYQFASAVRMLKSFEAVRMLVAAELNDAAGAVLRCLLEQHFVFHAVKADPNCMQSLAKEASAESYKALGELMKMNTSNRPDELTDERLLEAQAEHTQGSSFAAFNWAGRVGMTDTYRTLWRTLSTYVHGGSSGLERYISMDDQGVVLGIRSKIAQDKAVEFVLVGASIVLESVQHINSLPFAEVVSARLDHLFETQGRLYTQYLDMVSDGDASMCGDQVE